MIDVTEVRLWVLEEHDDVGEVYQIYPPTHTRHYDVEGALKCCQCVPQAKWHARVLVGWHVARERCLVAVALRNRHLPVSPQCIKR